MLKRIVLHCYVTVKFLNLSWGFSNSTTSSRVAMSSSAYEVAEKQNHLLVFFLQFSFVFNLLKNCLKLHQSQDCSFFFFLVLWIICYQLLVFIWFSAKNLLWVCSCLLSVLGKSYCFFFCFWEEEWQRLAIIT